jgi:hypothetical protein
MGEGEGELTEVTAREIGLVYHLEITVQILDHLELNRGRFSRKDHDKGCVATWHAT